MRIDPKDVEALVRDAGATVVGAAVLVKRSDGRVDVPLHALWEVAMQTYDPSTKPSQAVAR